MANAYSPRVLLVTGGCGFIGTNFVRHVLDEHAETVIHNLDALTYAGSSANLADVADRYPGRYHFHHSNIHDRRAVERVFSEAGADTIVNFAAESHVDRSIDNPLAFIETNVLGTGVLLDAARRAWSGRTDVRFHHVSTDEVFGSLGAEGLFTEATPYDPSSPYSASKAGADHLVRAWIRTYGFPATITNCSNNYGPWQFPEKLIPLAIANALAGKPIPVYGKGANIRDWLHVEDHCRAIWEVLVKGKPGATYNVGADNERTNIELVRLLCSRLDRIRPRASGTYADLIAFVSDRPGHDARYAIDSSRIRNDLGWRPLRDFATGLDDTIRWYLENEAWVEQIRASRYDGRRLGLS